MGFENKGWKKKGEKQGGARGAGELGGVYINEATGKEALIKKDSESVNFDIAEYMCSKVFEAVAPGSGAKVEFIVPDGEVAKKDNIYVISEFFADYNDMYKDMDKKLHSDAASKIARKDGRPMFMGTREWLNNTLTKAFRVRNYRDFDKIAPLSLLVGDFDIHPGNIGVVGDEDKGEGLKLVRIDFGWGFANLEGDVHPHNRSKHLPGAGPTNHYLEFPELEKTNEFFFQGLYRAGTVDLTQVLSDAFDTVVTFYHDVRKDKDGNVIPFRVDDKNNADEIVLNWGRHAFKQSKETFKGKKNADIKKDVLGMMKFRQRSLLIYALQIKLGQLIDTKGGYINTAAAEIDLYARDPLLREAMIEMERNKEHRKVRFQRKAVKESVLLTVINKALKNTKNLPASDYGEESKF
ncbi:hypothetical protein [Thalassomonas haliotis]|uniref:LepB N-terminal domain-containing protein n=1 Tax=Thalassomonas haliotis TaxID=485448 RepID=A0ABY7VJZ5_9GAMM|nr:hypothetical protein [Thalassomonas haliotis]WDE13717.1 hypothetical protein H3N35_09935 [Thalassomonas haliotis]